MDFDLAAGISMRPVLQVSVLVVAKLEDLVRTNM